MKEVGRIQIITAGGGFLEFCFTRVFLVKEVGRIQIITAGGGFLATKRVLDDASYKN